MGSLCIMLTLLLPPFVDSSRKPYEVGTLLAVPILQSGTLSLTAVLRLAQHLLATDVWSWVWTQTSGFSKPKANSSACPIRKH